jgi:hypothetical protein
MSATYVTGMMESYWGMGVGVSSLPALQELQIMAGKAVQKPKGGTGIGFTKEPGSKRDDIMPDQLGERIEHNLVRLLEKTEELLRENRREILSIAHALETHKTLDGEDVVAVIEKRHGPLVDGTVYADDDFFEEIEEYHRDVVAAHVNHRKVTVELPRPTSQVLTLEPSAVVSSAGMVMGPHTGSNSGPHALMAPPPVAGTAVVAPPPTFAPAPLGNGSGPQPDFMPWNGAAQPTAPYGEALYPPAPEPRKKSGGAFWGIVGAAITLIVLVLLGVAVFAAPGTEAGATAGLSTGTVVMLFAAFVGVVGLIVVATALIRNQQASRRQAEEARDRAAERAQLLAAAMDPEVAMRLLGYDGRRGPDSTA